MTTSFELRTQSRSGLRKRAGWFARLLIAIMALAWLVSLIDPQQIINAWQRISPGYFVLASALWFANLGLQVYKWHLIINSASRQVSLRDSARSLFGSYTLGIITPGRWGEIGRALFLPGCDWKTVSWLAFFDRATNALAIIFLGAIGFLLYPALLERAAGSASYTIATLVGLLLLLPVLVVLIPALRRRVAGWLQARYPQSAWPQLLHMTPRSGLLLRTSALAFAFAFVFAVQQVLLVRGFSVGLAMVPGVFAVFAIHTIKTLLPVSFGDLGIREGTTALLLASQEVPAAVSVSAALLLFFINVAIPALIGIPFVLTAKKTEAE